jgi:hypothetical protein
MESFIYENNSLSENFCNEIIELFEANVQCNYKNVVDNECFVDNIIKQERKIALDSHTLNYKYVVDSECLHDKLMKNPINLVISPDMLNHDIWFNIKKMLIDELIKHVKLYETSLNNDIFFFNLLHNTKSIKTFFIQKYKKNEGCSEYRDDYNINLSNKKTKLLTFIWYLNTVDEGGETEFLDYYSVKSEKGKLVLFPSEWFFPYYQKNPISHDKYVITGWIYIDI